MTQTTTDYNACDASLWLDNAAGTLTDISGSSNSLGKSFTQVTGQTTTFQASGWVVRKAGCAKEATITVTILGTTAATEAFSLLHDWYFNYGGTLRTFVWYEPDKNVGSHKFSGEYVIESLDGELPSDASDPVQMTAVLKSSGAVTWVTNAT